MEIRELSTLVDELASSQQLVVAMVRIAAGDGSARVGAWSLRDIAAHLAASERECFEPRIRAMASGEHPEFDFYTNDERSRTFGPPQFEEAAKTLLTIHPDTATALELMRHRRGDVRGRAILECLRHGRQPWARTALEKGAPHALAYLTTP